MTSSVEAIEIATGLTRREVLKGLAAIGLVPAALTTLVGCETVIEDLLEAIANRPTRRNIGGMESGRPDNPCLSGCHRPDAGVASF